jgi:hypothetical protein
MLCANIVRVRTRLIALLKSALFGYAATLSVAMQTVLYPLTRLRSNCHSENQKALMAKASCPECNAKTAASAHVCPACGFPLTPPQPVRRRQWPKRKKDMSEFSKAVLVIGGVFAALLFLTD